MSPKVKNILEWGYCIIIAIVLALLVRYFIGTPTTVKQRSMYPTLKPDEKLILNRLSITMKKDMKRGEIITFEAPSVTKISHEDANMANPVAIYNNEPKGVWGNFVYNVLEFGKTSLNAGARYGTGRRASISNKTSYIKRIIALPGEHIEIKNNKVYINGEELKEPYLASSVVTTPLDGEFFDLIVPDGYVFAMGDNRSKSTDCRTFGCIPLEKVEGIACFRFWPLNRLGNPDKK